jgi:hypothetical protein
MVTAEPEGEPKGEMEEPRVEGGETSTSGKTLATDGEIGEEERSELEKEARYLSQEDENGKMNGRLKALGVANGRLKTEVGNLKVS